MDKKTWTVTLTVTEASWDWKGGFVITSDELLKEFLLEGLEDIGGRIKDMKVISTKVERNLPED